MNRHFFLKSSRCGFSLWGEGDLPLAEQLWGNPEVTRYICATGVFSPADIKNRLQTEISNGRDFNVQYWPFFELNTNKLIGCCGLRPHAEGGYEIGFHLLPEFWHQGYATEAAQAVIDYAFTKLKTPYLFAGHNPKNTQSQQLLLKLGFQFIGAMFYPPTGLEHPSYKLENPTRK